MNADNECTYDGCNEPVHASGKCRRHYWRDYKRLQRPARDPNVVRATAVVQPDVDYRNGPGRPAQDQVVYKIRFALPTGGSNTKHYSDPKVAQRLARRCEEDGTLLFFGKYQLTERIDQ